MTGDALLDAGRAAQDATVTDLKVALVAAIAACQAATAAVTAQLTDRDTRDLNRERIPAHARVLAYARDSQDRMLVNASTGNITASLNFGTTSNGVPSWFANGSPNSMDQREVQRDISTQTIQNNRARWVIT